jgi:hypothetical protein
MRIGGGEEIAATVQRVGGAISSFNRRGLRFSVSSTFVQPRNSS